MSQDFITFTPQEKREAAAETKSGQPHENDGGHGGQGVQGTLHLALPFLISTFSEWYFFSFGMKGIQLLKSLFGNNKGNTILLQLLAHFLLLQFPLYNY